MPKKPDVYSAKIIGIVPDNLLRRCPTPSFLAGELLTSDGVIFAYAGETWEEADSDQVRVYRVESLVGRITYDRSTPQVTVTIEDVDDPKVEPNYLSRLALRNGMPIK